MKTNILKIIVLTILTLGFVSACNSHNNNQSIVQSITNNISGRYLENGQYKLAEFVLLKPSKVVDGAVSTVDLYGKVGSTISGNFYWQKVADPFDDINLGKVPATFRENRLWPIE